MLSANVNERSQSYDPAVNFVRSGMKKEHKTALFLQSITLYRPKAKRYLVRLSWIKHLGRDRNDVEQRCRSPHIGGGIPFRIYLKQGQYSAVYYLPGDMGG